MRALRIAFAFLACLTLSACFVSQTPLIPQDRSVKAMPDSGTVTSKTSDEPDDDADVFRFKWTGAHYELTGVTGDESPKTGKWTFASLDGGYYILQMERTDGSSDPVEYYLVRPGKGADLILFVPECLKLSDAERAALRLEASGPKSQCLVKTFAQLESAMKAAIKTLDEPNSHLVVNTAP